MKARELLSCALLAALVSCQSVPTQLRTDGSDLRQLFRILWTQPGGPSDDDDDDDGDNFAGHAFLVDRNPAPPLALTAFHVAGPLSPAPQGAGVAVAYAWLRSPVDPAVVMRLGQRVPILGARTISAAGSQDDMAAFQVIDWTPDRALQLAPDLPAVGDTVWVLAVHSGDQPLNGARHHPARVDVSHDSAFVYTYLASSNTNYTSGAAVLDRTGRVVGVNVGTLALSLQDWQRYRDKYPSCCVNVRGGDVVGLAVGVRSIRRHLAGLATR